MRAQQRASRRPILKLAERPEFVKDIDCLRSGALSDTYQCLLVLLDEYGAPPNFDRAATIRTIHHRTRIGAAFGIRPSGTFAAPQWSDAIRSLGLDVVSYAVADPSLEVARETNVLELYVRALRLLHRDRKIDGVLVVAPTGALGPLARQVHDRGLPLIIADARCRLNRWDLLADATFAIDDFLTGENK